MVTSFFYMPHADTRLIHAVLKKITAADSERAWVEGYQNKLDLHVVTT